MHNPRPLYQLCESDSDDDPRMMCNKPAYGWAGKSELYPFPPRPACQSHMEEGNYD